MHTSELQLQRRETVRGAGRHRRSWRGAPLPTSGACDGGRAAASRGAGHGGGRGGRLVGAGRGGRADAAALPHHDDLVALLGLAVARGEVSAWAPPSTWLGHLSVIEPRNQKFPEIE